MGISGLLPLLKSIQVNTHIKQYAGKVVGVDAYVWLHKGAFACAWDLALGNPTTKYVDYAMHRIKMFRHFGVEPYVVFDGDYLPSKLHTEDSRAAKRAEKFSLGMRLHAQGQKSRATECFQKCIDITPEMAHRFILALRREDISYVVAPYEADAQLAYLEKMGTIQAIVTEDSDLLVFGCKTLLLKMNQFGDCVEIKREKFANVTGTLSLHGWTDDDFRHMAILSGCDYLASVSGVGLINAHKLLRRFNRNIQRVVQSLRMQFGTRVPADYLDSFHRANLTFKHQRVFCPERECLVMWNEPSEPLADEILVYIGADLDVETARGVARGELHPMTKAPLGIPSTDKENKNKQGGSPYKPKPPTPPKSSTIKKYFSPKRSKSLQDITSLSRKRDAQKSNTPEPARTPASFFKAPQKRPFTAVEKEESIAQKRAKRYLGASDEDEVIASPFFATSGMKGTAASGVEGEGRSVSMVEVTTQKVVEMVRDDLESTVEDNTAMEISQSTEERQVSESPPRKWAAETTPAAEDEVVLDSPTAKRSTIFNESQISETTFDCENIDISTHEVVASPGYESPEADIFPLSSPPSRPLIMALPKPTTQVTIQVTSQTTIDTPTFISKLATTQKKTYTPRPSHQSIFPDTPTPSSNPQQNLLIQEWKERFSLDSSATPKLQSTISTKPMTPVHTPLFRRAIKTPGMGNLVRKAAITTSAGRATIINDEPTVQVEEAELDGVEQIEEVSPPRARTTLERFRFQGR